jgi:2-polyprenyl-3-methyl-5-hydroxy-6-metoxy-1,4-benzoquinol methylase
MSSRDSFFLPDGYTSREVPAFFDDAPNLSSKVVHQPDVYAFADYLLRVSGRRTVIDIGCGSGRKLLALSAGKRIGLDYRANIQTCRAAFPQETWVEVDLERGGLPPIGDLDASDAVVVCSDVVEHLVNPENLLDMLARLYEQRAIVLVSTPARTRARGADHMGPPGNPAHVREWSLLELERLLEAWGLPATFAGYTLNNTRKRRKHTILTVHDLGVNEALRTPAKIRPPLARISGDNHGPTTVVQIAALEREGVDVEIVGPDAVDSAASETDESRWIMALEPGEIPGSPWEDLNLRAAFAVIEASGAQAVAFAMLEMAKPRASSQTPLVPEPFAFAQPAESYARIRAWRQGRVTGDLPAVARKRWPYTLHCRSYGAAGASRAVLQQLAGWVRWQETPQYAAGFHADYLVERLSDVAATRKQFLARL